MMFDERALMLLVVRNAALILGMVMLLGAGVWWAAIIWPAEDCQKLWLYCDLARIERDQVRTRMCDVVDYCGDVKSRHNSTCESLLRAIGSAEAEEKAEAHK